MPKSVFQSTSASTPELINTASALVAKGVVPIGAPADFIARIKVLDAKMKNMRHKAKINARMTSSTFSATDSIFDFGTMLAPWPVSVLPWIIGKKNAALKEFALKTMNDSAEAALKRVAADTANKIISDFDQDTVKKAWSSGKAEEQAAFISKVISSLDGNYNSLGPEAKYQLARAASSIVAALVKNPGDSLDNTPKIGVSEAVSQYARSIDLSRTMLEKEATLVAKTEELAQEAETAAKQLSETGNVASSVLASLESLSIEVLKASQVVPDVLGAFVALGMNVEDAENIQVGVDIIASSAALYIDSFKTPLTSISAASNLVSSVFGGSSRSRAAQRRHQQIMKSLHFIQRQNQQILENQKRIVEGIATINHNQGAILQVLGGVKSSVYFNYEMLVSLVTGPLDLLSLEIDRHPDFFSSPTAMSAQLPYEDIRYTFEKAGDRIYKGLAQLEEVFTRPTKIHPILKSASYHDTGTLELKGVSGLSKFTVDRAGSSLELETSLQHKISFLQRNNVSIRALTEYATLDCLVVGVDRLQNVSSIQYEDLLSAGLINKSLLCELAMIALRSHHLFQFINFDSGLYSVKSEDELLDSTPSDRGFFLLQTILAQINLAIAQTILSGDGFVALQSLLRVLRGRHIHGTIAEEETLDTSLYESIDPDGAIISTLFLQQASDAGIPLRNIHKRKMDQLFSDTLYEWDDSRRSAGVHGDSVHIDYLAYTTEEEVAQSDVGVRVNVNFDPDFDPHMSLKNIPRMKADDIADTYTSGVDYESEKLPVLMYSFSDLPSSYPVLSHHSEPDADVVKYLHDVKKSTGKLDIKFVSNWLERTSIFPKILKESDSSDLQFLLSIKDLVAGELIPYQLREEHDDSLRLEWTQIIAESMVSEP